MWPGEQQPGGGPNQQPNPYHQPGYQQQGQQQGYQQPAPWNAPTVPGGPAQAPHDDGGGSGRGGNRTKIVAIVAAAAVVVAAGVTGFLLLGGDKDDTAKPDPTRSASTSPSPARSEDADARGGGGGPKPTIAGWKTVTNAERGIAFDAPPEWELKAQDRVDAVGEIDDPDSILIAMMAPAALKQQWCASDPDRDGVKDYTPLAEAGSRGNRSAKSTEEIAKKDSAMWVHGRYSQPGKKNVRTSSVEPYTTKSGITGSLTSSSVSGVKNDKNDKCRTDGKATTFGFKDSQGKLVSWSFFGARDVSGEVPEATVKKMLSTVREYDNGPES
ncbi:hypothetical protein OG453_19535 [Streptomyces sp. NBC_01381]|uniref:hypothetical protein n=1 Tax=Streptomyces sp. NBC_01381 TaxID=2903845 RepID=UPI0022549E5E|nr:hypothetical protein [Streptomyces sp. NBC_01381]MCX4668839.1 hypothetical protein [Streptomyces sp. NBC_01381]